MMEQMNTHLLNQKKISKTLDRTMNLLLDVHQNQGNHVPRDFQQLKKNKCKKQIIKFC